MTNPFKNITGSMRIHMTRFRYVWAEPSGFGFGCGGWGWGWLFVSGFFVKSIGKYRALSVLPMSSVATPPVLYGYALLAQWKSFR
jgi:hypothetical protein